MTPEGQVPESDSGQQTTPAIASGSGSDASFIEQGSHNPTSRRPNQGRIQWLKNTVEIVPQRLQSHVDLEYADTIFLICYFLSGICDSSAYRAWGCFVSMQTGIIHIYTKPPTPKPQTPPTNKPVHRKHRLPRPRRLRPNPNPPILIRLVKIPRLNHLLLSRQFHLHLYNPPPRPAETSCADFQFSNAMHPHRHRGGLT